MIRRLLKFLAHLLAARENDATWAANFLEQRKANFRPLTYKRHEGVPPTCCKGPNRWADHRRRKFVDFEMTRMHGRQPNGDYETYFEQVKRRARELRCNNSTPGESLAFLQRLIARL